MMGADALHNDEVMSEDVNSQHGKSRERQREDTMQSASRKSECSPTITKKSENGRNPHHLKLEKRTSLDGIDRFNFKKCVEIM